MPPAGVFLTKRRRGVHELGRVGARAAGETGQRAPRVGRIGRPPLSPCAAIR